MSIFSQDKKDFSKYKIYGRKPLVVGGLEDGEKQSMCLYKKNRTVLKFNKHYKPN